MFRLFGRNVRRSTLTTAPNSERKEDSMRNRIKMTKDVFEQIKSTIGSRPAETGGILGMRNGVVDAFYFDNNGERSRATYSPDIESINRELEENWTPNDIIYMGAIHSHPRGIIGPSGPDAEYGERLLINNLKYDKAKPYFYLPIVQPEDEFGPFALYSYVGVFENKRFRIKETDLYVDDKLYKPASVKTPVQIRRTPRNFDRVEALFPLSVMAEKTLVCIGTGGARSYIENLARSGVGRFVLFDADEVSETNIGTQNVYYSELGKRKVEAIHARVSEINPNASVTAVAKFLDDTMEDGEFERLVGKQLTDCPKNVVIAGCTDNFYANARASRLALKYGTPYLQAGLYMGGSGAEVFFSYPGVTPSCARCATQGRYKEYETGYINETTSHGTPIFATEMMNAMKGYLTLMLMLYGTDSRFGAYLDKYRNRNFLQINLDPFSGLWKTKENFLGEMEFFSQWPEHPNFGGERCPDCGGTANLNHTIGQIDDARAIFEDEKEDVKHA